MKDLSTLCLLLLPLVCFADIGDPEVVAAEALFSGAEAGGGQKQQAAHRTMRVEGAPPAALVEIQSDNMAEARQQLASSTRKVIRSELHGLKMYLSDLFFHGGGDSGSLVQLADLTDPTDPKSTIADLQAMDMDIKRQPKRPEHPKGVFQLRPFEDKEAKQLEELDMMINPSKKGLPPIPDRKKESLAEQKIAYEKARKAALERPPDEDDVTKAMDGSEDSMERLSRALQKQSSFNPMIQEAKQKRLADVDESLQEQIDMSKERALNKKRHWPPPPSDSEPGSDDLFKNLPDASAFPGPKVDLDSLLKESQPSADGKEDIFAKADISKLLDKLKH